MSNNKVFCFDGWIIREDDGDSPCQSSLLGMKVTHSLEVYYGGRSMEMCPSCGKELIQILTIKGKNELPFLNFFFPEREQDKDVTLPFVFCPRCAYALNYRFSMDGELELIGDEDGNFEHAYQGDDFPYPNYPDSFPIKSAKLIAVPPSYSDVFSQILSLSYVGRRGYATLRDLITENVLNAKEGEMFFEWYRKNVSPDLFHCTISTNFLDREFKRNQIFGVPFLVQYNDFLDCSYCSSRMVCVGGFFGLPRIDFDLFYKDENCFIEVHYWYCKRCKIMEVYAEGD